MGFLDKLFGRPAAPASKDIAKERLQVTLVSDRMNISPGMMEILKDEIISSISRHVEIDQAAVEITMTRGRGFNRLVADIPILGTPPPRPKAKRKRSSKKEVAAPVPQG